MGTVLLSEARENTFKDEKMLFSILSASLVVLAAGSALPEERISCSFPPGTCMAWTWSSVSGCKCTKEVNIAPVDLDKFREDALTAHNAYRAKHGVPALKLNDELNDVAQEWADYLMAVDGFEHRHPNKYGENLYMSSGRAAQEQAQGSSEVGVGVAQKGSKVIVVANYSPPGNYIGQHADNVFPPQ